MLKTRVVWLPWTCYSSSQANLVIEKSTNSFKTLDLREQMIHLTPSSSFEYHTNQQTMENNCESDDLVEYFKFKKGKDSPSDARNALLVMAVLMATTTLQVGINPPSGIWQDSDTKGNGTNPEHRAGRSVLGSYNPSSYLLFVIFNTTRFSIPIYMLAILTNNLPMRLELRICVHALYFSYSTALIDMASQYGTIIVVIIVLSLFYLTTHYVINLIRLIIKIIERVLSGLLNWFGWTNYCLVYHKRLYVYDVTHI